MITTKLKLESLTLRNFWIHSMVFVPNCKPKILNQKQVEKFIRENNIDKNDSEQSDRIVDFYKSQNPDLKVETICYGWDKSEKHKLFSFYGTSFIRDDTRFHNPRLPACLQYLNFNLHNPENAIKIADALHEYFENDNNLMDFARWLKITSKYCFRYRFSY